MIAFIRMYNKPDVKIDCKELIVRDGAKYNIDGEDCQMLAVISADEIYHPVIDIEVM